jgi:3',5'-cyclic-AMP phosphodiesterase
MERVVRLNAKPLRLIQITDPHLGGASTETLLGLNTEESLCDLLRHIRDSGVAYDLIVASGDISNDGTPASYHRFIDRVSEYLPKVPIAWLPGNHDNPSSMKQFAQGVFTEDFAFGDWHFILLNSRIPFEEGGELSEKELNRLEQLLQLRPTRPTMIFLHHQPVPVGSAWIDQYVVKNASAFFNLLNRFPNVKAVAWGHVHQEFHQQQGNLQLFASPSSCIQFKPQSQQFCVDHLMPGARHYELFADGHIESGVTRAEKRIYCIDFASTGY